MNIDFTKMHGIGNDFIVLDCRKDGRLAGIPDGRWRDMAIFMCDRRKGIGADQILLLTDSTSADFRMVIYNSDGSEVEMCGNGIRCLAKYIWDNGLSDASVLNIETRAGIIRPERSRDMVKVDMGQPEFSGKAIPVRHEGVVRELPIMVGDMEFKITCVSMGNPHAVIVMKGIDDFPVRRYGPIIEGHVLFPNRTNVEFIEIVDRSTIKMRVWERGAGETMACGTGACGAMAAARLLGLTDDKVLVRLRGGDLMIEYNGAGSVFMTGPATTVFSGTIEI